MRYAKQKAEGRPGWTAEYGEKERALDAFLARWRVPPGGRFLELGCGAGNITLYMAGKGFGAYGIDISSEGIAWAKEKRAASKLYADFRVGSAVDLPGYPDGFFDVVYDGGCLIMVIGSERRTCMAGVHRILRPGGVFFAGAHELNPEIHEPYVVSPEVRFDPEQRCLFHGDIPMYWISLEEEFVEEVRSAGFEMLRFEKSSPSERLKDSPIIAGHMAIVARKPEGR